MYIRVCMRNGKTAHQQWQCGDGGGGGGRNGQICGYQQWFTTKIRRFIDSYAPAYVTCIHTRIYVHIRIFMVMLMMAFTAFYLLPTIAKPW